MAAPPQQSPQPPKETSGKLVVAVFAAGIALSIAIWLFVAGKIRTETEAGEAAAAAIDGGAGAR